MSTTPTPIWAEVQALADRCAEAGDPEIALDFERRFGVTPDAFTALDEHAQQKHVASLAQAKEIHGNVQKAYGVFDTPYDQYASRKGQRFELLGVVDPSTYDSADAGTMYHIKFDDGAIIEAWPEEVESALKQENAKESQGKAQKGAGNPMSKNFIIQHLPTGDYDYSEFVSIEAAWETEKNDSWVQSAIIEGEKTPEEVKAEFVSGLKEYSEQEVLQAALDDYAWPENLGLVDFVGVDDFTGIRYAFNLHDVEINSIDGNDAVRATIVTAHGELEVVEWLDEDGDVERSDSNIKTNMISDLAKLFPCERPSLAPMTDYLPLPAIFEALQEKLEELRPDLSKQVAADDSPSLGM